MRMGRDVARWEFARPDLDQTFVNEFVSNGLNWVKAAEACGVKKGAAALAYGRAMLQKKHVQAAIKDCLQRKAEASSITADGILTELRRVAMATIGEYLDESGEVNIMSIMRPEAAAVGEVTTTSHTDADGNTTRRVKVKLHDKLKALELLGRNLTLWTDKLEVGGLDGLAEALKLARERVESGK